MEYKDILLSIDACGGRQQRTKLGLTLAKKHKARLLGCYVSPTVGELPARRTGGVVEGGSTFAVAAGKLHVQVGKTFRLDQIVEAYRCMEENKASGKIIVLT